MTTILFLCTGNAARSVMAAAMLRTAAPELAEHDVAIASAGTHSIPGLPMSTRTRTALAEHDVADPHHLSAQLEHDMVDQASVIAVFEPMHVSYMRKKHADAAHKVASLPRLVRDLADGPLVTLADRLAALDLAHHTFEPWEEVIDPAGGDLAVFQASATEIGTLIGDFRAKIGVDVDASA